MKRLMLSLLAASFVAGSVWAAGPAVRETHAQQVARMRKEASEHYQKITEAYMKGEFTELAAAHKAGVKHIPFMAPEQKKDVMYVKQAASEHRPAWWKNCVSSSNTSFEAAIWRRKFIANYMPSRAMGFQWPVGIKNGQVQIIVSWRPNLVNNPKPLGGGLAKIHKMRKGDYGEAVVWHELGHNYITTFLPTRHVIELYDKHTMLFDHLQEFYADMTAVYHCSPKARLAGLMSRLDELDRYSEEREHTRASLAIGSLLLSHWLSNPADWPSVHVPPEVPKEDVERNTVVYVYEHIDPKWTLAEDRALRQSVRNFIMTKGSKTLSARGTLPLPNKLKFSLMAAQDRVFQKQRDAWVAKQLEAAISSGRADKPGSKDKGRDKHTITVVVKDAGGKIIIEREVPRRIEIPW